MKKSLNQRGAIGAVEVALVVVLLAAGGFVAWRISSADKAVNESATNSDAALNSNTDAMMPAARYNSPKYGYSFALPEAWKPQDSPNKAALEAIVYVSPDYKRKTPPPDVGSDMLKGAQISVTVSKTEYKTLAEYKADIEQGSGYVRLDTVKATKLDGVDALRMDDGHHTLMDCVSTVHKGNLYDVCYEWEQENYSETHRDKYAAEFEAVLKSFKFAD